MSAPTVQSFLADAYAQEIAMFRAALDAVPEGEFHTARLGHAAAWHALHVAEWMRFYALQDFSPTYAHLGWEDAPWMAEFRGEPRVPETAPKADALAELDRAGASVVEHIRTLRDDQLQDELRSPAAPTGVRPRLTGLSLHLRHIAYHRGQVQQAKAHG